MWPLLYEVSGIVRFLGSCQGAGGGRAERYSSMGAEFQFGKMITAWGWMAAMVANNVSVLSATDCTFKDGSGGKLISLCVLAQY